MGKIYINSKVAEAYRAGEDVNDAIRENFYGEIQDKIKTNAAFEKLTPIQMVMHDAGITSRSEVGDIIDAGTYTSGGMESNEWLFPVWIDTVMKEKAFGQNILQYIVKNSQPIDGNTIQSAALDLTETSNKKAVTLARIAELADIPTGTIKIGSTAITLWKHGRAIQMSYESVRRMRIPLFTIQMDAIMADVVGQNVNFAADTLINGDGNPGTAATKIATTKTANTLTAKDIIDAMVDYSDANNTAPDILIVSKDRYKEIVTMLFDPTLISGVSNAVKFKFPQLNLENLQVIKVHPDIAKINNKEVAIFADSQRTLIRYEENGSTISENQKFARNQSQLLTFTENSGYAISVMGTNMYLEVKAS